MDKVLMGIAGHAEIVRYTVMGQLVDQRVRFVGDSFPVAVDVNTQERGGLMEYLHSSHTWFKTVSEQ